MAEATPAQAPGTEAAPAADGAPGQPSAAEQAANELQRRITEAFELFDHESNKTADVREIGTIVRYLDCCPTEGELQDLIAQMEDEEPTGYIRFEKFLPVMIKVLSERRYRCETEDILLRAFQVMDTDNKGYLTQEELTKFMTEEGEILSPDEMEEMLGAAVDPEKGYINYKEYVTKLVIHDTK